MGANEGPPGEALKDWVGGEEGACGRRSRGWSGSEAQRWTGGRDGWATGEARRMSLAAAGSHRRWRVSHPHGGLGGLSGAGDLQAVHFRRRRGRGEAGDDLDSLSTVDIPARLLRQRDDAQGARELPPIQTVLPLRHNLPHLRRRAGRGLAHGGGDAPRGTGQPRARPRRICRIWSLMPTSPCPTGEVTRPLRGPIRRCSAPRRAPSWGAQSA